MKKRNKKDLIIPIFVAALILIFAASLLLFPGKILLAPGELSVDRNLPDSAQLNQQFTVTLNIYTAADKPAAIGITEQVPAGWTIEIEDVQLNNLGNDNLEFYRKINNGELEILVFSLFTNVTDFIITYTITPTTTSASFSGTWESVDPDSSGNIGGDTSLTINTGSGGSSLGGGGGGGGGGGSYTPTQPRTNQTQATTCQENWICSAWTECENEKQTRTCSDTSACGTSTTKPIEQASCNPVIAAAEKTADYSFRHSSQTILILLIAIVIVIIAIVVIIKKRRK